MVAGSNDIEDGMTVYGSDGEKIGTVHLTDGGSAGDDTGSDAGYSGGGAGALGDESSVYADTGAGGGEGTLGDETRVDTDTGQAGGPGTLGDESRVDNDYASTGTNDVTWNAGASDTGAGTVPGSGATGTTPGMGAGDLGPEMVVEEVTVVEVEPGSAFASADAGTGSGTSGGYFEVDHGGIFGIGTRHLYVPYSAVQSVQAGDSVTLNCTKDECVNQYQDNPAGT
jgi:hypothetical protein